MQIFIKERIKNLRSSHYFVITSNGDENGKQLITGQLLRDVNFSLIGEEDEIIKLRICFGHPDDVQRTIDFDYTINVNDTTQYFELNNEMLEITFNYSKYEKKYMICCPSFILRK